VSQHERLNIEAHYHRIVTGDLDKARDTYQLWTATYPRDATAHADFAVALSMLGQYERALEENSEARGLEPVDTTLAANAVNFEMALGRLQAACADYEKAVQQRLESDYLHSLGYSLAFLDRDATGMAQQVAWAAGRPGIEDVLLAAEADTEAYSGHLARARDLSGQAAESAARAGEQEVAAGWLAVAALARCPL
jgi:tetratricopeptide (TPR) repeat protein